MRIGETIALDDNDFDTDVGLLVVHHAKLAKANTSAASATSHRQTPTGISRPHQN
jgi:integrase